MPRCASADPRVGLLALLLAAACAGCIQDDGSRFNPIEVVAPSVSEDDERQLGMEFDRELQKHVKVIHDPVVAGFINDLGQSLVQQIEPQPYIYRFRVIEDPSLNAFAVPGGYIYVHSGTLLAVSRLDEIAGILGHEIAHVKARHFARMQQKSQLPDLLAGIAGMAAAIATREPGALVATQAANVAMKLRFSREFETEADSLGGIFMTRAGYDPAGITPFFERILEEQKRYPNDIPPYLFSHPDVKDRIAAVRDAAATLRPTREPDPGLREALRVAQARLGLLIDSKRASLPGYVPSDDSGRSEALLAEADRLARDGDLDAALTVLARAEAGERLDPRISFRIGELLLEAGRYDEAVAAYRRTLRLDASRAMVFFKLGQAYKEVGDRHRAVYAYEQALMRAGESSSLRERAEWEVYKLTFTVVRAAGFADGSSRRDADTPVGRARKGFSTDESRMAWWAELGARFVPYAGRMTVRWTDPNGRVVQEEPVARYRKPFVGSTLELGEAGLAPGGEWTVEARLEGDVIDRRSVTVTPSL